jgi:nitrite reductase/ring-hydroxylating ferredoxin subunit
VLSGGYFVGLHGHPPRNKNERKKNMPIHCKIEVKDVLNQNNKPISINDLNNLIDNAINEIKSYLNKCTNGGYGRIGQSQGRYNTRIGGS